MNILSRKLLLCILTGLTASSLYAGGGRSPKKVEKDEEKTSSSQKKAPPEKLKKDFEEESPRVEYRNVKDDEKLLRQFFEARKQIRSGQSRKAYREIENYINENPQGQFADEAAVLLAERANEQYDFEAAAKYGEKILALSPPSRYRSKALYYIAKGHESKGDRKKALETLSTLRLNELPKRDRPEFFAFWGKVAEQESRYLESVLAYLRALRSSTNSKEVVEMRANVETQVRTRLSESELQFLLKEYRIPTFPSLVAQLRIANLQLAQGSRSRAERSLGLIVKNTPPGNTYHQEAKKLLLRMERLGKVQAHRVGVLLPLGDASTGSYGEAVRRGLELAIGVNESNRMELVYADSGSSVSSALSAMERLVFEEQVIGIVGPPSGVQASATSVKAGEWGVPYITLSARDGLVEQNSFIFQVAATPQKQVQALVNFAWTRMNARNFAVMFPEDSFGEQFAEAYFEEVKKHGGQITAAESYPPSQSDFRHQIENMVGLGFSEFRKEELTENIKKEEEKIGRELRPRERMKFKNPPIVDFDVLFLPDAYRAVGQIAPYLKLHDIDNVKLIGPSTWHNAKLLSRAGRYLNNAMFVDTFASDRPGPQSENFLKIYKEKYGRSPGSLDALGYDIGRALQVAFTRSGFAPRSRDELRNRLESLGPIQGVLGQQNWDKSRSVLSEMQLYAIRQSSFRFQGGIPVGL